MNTSAPNTLNTFNTKSLLVHEDAPLSQAATDAFMKYLSEAGYDSITNTFILYVLLLLYTLPYAHHFLADSSFGAESNLATYAYF